MRVLHVTSEVAPLSKTGGLGDVLGALPIAQRTRGDQVVVLTPRYGFIPTDGEPVTTLEVTLDSQIWSVQIRAQGSVWLVDVPGLLDRENIYGYADDPLRFGVLCKVAAALAERFDVAHLHDWPTALTALYLDGRRPVVQTVHNLAYQGVIPFEWADRLAIPERLRTFEGLEFHGQLNLLKAGLVLADRVTTVSPRYAVEICSEPGGQGLSGLFAHRTDSLVGLLNGIDVEGWNPATDPALPAPFSAKQLNGRVVAKAAVQSAFSLQDGPLLGVISRAAHQKGLDLVADVATQIVERGARVALLTDGDPELLQRLRNVASALPGRFSVIDRFDRKLARRMYAGCDFVLVPSRFEPCGLTQMYAMRYGALPIVRKTGGLADTVDDGRTGLTFFEPTGAALLAAIDRALALSPAQHTQMQHAAMSQDWSWTRAADRYAATYAEIQNEAL